MYRVCPAAGEQALLRPEPATPGAPGRRRRPVDPRPARARARPTAGTGRDAQDHRLLALLTAAEAAETIRILEAAAAIAPDPGRSRAHELAEALRTRLTPAPLPEGSRTAH